MLIDLFAKIILPRVNGSCGESLQQYCSHIKKDGALFRAAAVSNLGASTTALPDTCSVHGSPGRGFARSSTNSRSFAVAK
jgi:hypothetical protein